MQVGIQDQLLLNHLISVYQTRSYYVGVTHRLIYNERRENEEKIQDGVEIVKHIPISIRTVANTYGLNDQQYHQMTKISKDDRCKMNKPANEGKSGTRIDLD